MSRIDDLIADLCPQGVEFRALGDAIVLNFGARITKVHDSGTLYPVYGGGGESFRTDNFNREDEYVVSRFAMSENCVRKVVGKFWMLDSGFTFNVADNSVSKDYVAYWLFNNQQKIYECSSQGAQKNLKTQEFKKFLIPIPPLEVQHEIVKLLDQLTRLNKELEAALNAELDARVIQYDALMQSVVEAIEAPKETLRQLGEWRGGVTPSKSNLRYWEGGSIPWLASMDVSASEGKEIRGLVTPAAINETSLRIIPYPSVVAVMRSNILRRRLPFGLVEVDTTVNQDIRALIPRDGVNADYVYQVLRSTSETIRKAVVRTDGSMAAVDSRAFFEWTIPVPPLAEQERIAVQLRELDSVSINLRESLVSESEARRRQYEHYRDRLLTFEEATA